MSLYGVSHKHVTTLIAPQIGQNLKISNSGLDRRKVSGFVICGMDIAIAVWLLEALFTTKKEKI